MELQKWHGDSCRWETHKVYRSEALAVEAGRLEASRSLFGWRVVRRNKSGNVSGVAWSAPFQHDPLWSGRALCSVASRRTNVEVNHG